jgi:hypothetical protein
MSFSTLMTLGIKGYAAQIAIHFGNASYKEAYDLSLEFVSVFPLEFLSNYSLAKSQYNLGLYSDSLASSLIAFKKAKDPQEINSSAQLHVLSLLCLGSWDEGLNFILPLEKKLNSSDFCFLVFLLYYSKSDAKNTLLWFDRLCEVDSKRSQDLILDLLNGRRFY